MELLNWRNVQWIKQTLLSRPAELAWGSLGEGAYADYLFLSSEGRSDRLACRKSEFGGSFYWDTEAILAGEVHIFDPPGLSPVFSCQDTSRFMAHAIHGHGSVLAIWWIERDGLFQGVGWNKENPIICIFIYHTLGHNWPTAANPRLAVVQRVLPELVFFPSARVGWKIFSILAGDNQWWWDASTCNGAETTLCRGTLLFSLKCSQPCSDVSSMYHLPSRRGPRQSRLSTKTLGSVYSVYLVYSLLSNAWRPASLWFCPERLQGEVVSSRSL